MTQYIMEDALCKKYIWTHAHTVPPLTPARNYSCKKLLQISGILLLWYSLFSAAIVHAHDNPTYTLSRAPQSSVTKTVKAWEPFLKRILIDTGIDIKLKVYSSRDDFESDLFSGKSDFAFMNPYYEVLAKRKQGYIPLVRDSSRKLTPIIVVRKNSPIRTVQELDKKTIGFPDANAFGASLYPRAQLIEQEKIKFTPRYFGSHGNVYRNVFLGNVIAGGGVMKTLNRQPPKLREQLRVIYKTPLIAPHPLIAHPRVPKKIRDAVTAAILKFSQRDEAKVLLKAVKLEVPIVADYKRDYMSLEQINIGKCMNLPQE